MTDLLCRLWRCRKGSVAVNFALAVPVLLSVAALAIDTLGMVGAKNRLQTAADSAAVAAAHEFALPNSKEDTMLAVVDKYLEADGATALGELTRTVGVDKELSEIALDVTVKWPLKFGPFLGVSELDINTISKARLVTEPATVCILSLRKSSSKGIFLDDAASIRAESCGVFANSTHSSAMQLDKSTSIYAKITCSAGGVRRASGTIVDETELTDCPPIPDPLEGRKPPVVGGCDHNKLKIDTGTVTLAPGNYCGGLEISGNAKVNFQPGTYIISDGKLKFSNDSNSTGSDVGFYLTGSNTVLTCKDNASIRFSGAETGDLAGLLFFEDPSSSAVRMHSISCAHADELVGTIYLPRGRLQIDPSATVASQSEYTAIIVYEFSMSSGPTLVLNSDYAASNVPLPEGAKINGTAVITK